MNLNTVRVLWVALFFSTLVELGVVVWADFDRHVDLQPTTFGLVITALGVAAASFIIPRRIQTLALQQLALAVVEVPVQTHDATRDYRSPAGSQRVFRDPDAAKAGMLRAFQTAFILSLALAEAIAIMGLVVAQGRLAPSVFALPFFAVTWVLFGIRFPRVASIVEPAERLYAARLPT